MKLSSYTHITNVCFNKHHVYRILIISFLIKRCTSHTHTPRHGYREGAREREKYFQIVNISITSQRITICIQRYKNDVKFMTRAKKRGIEYKNENGTSGRTQMLK